MRLLNVNTNVLEVFLGLDVPPYAILSHTWEDEEVVYDDFANEKIEHTTKRGWYKIHQACAQALKDGYDYLWADTLCIDKSSSSELSEAINAMFNYYRNSTVCYAYLSGLPDVALEESRWFTRGWTLQEMIAPREVMFFDKTWTFLGSKSSLLDRLHSITGVDSMVLRGGSLGLISVARKMSWASKRQTTRPEDTAYCLLGLFGISMPMLYGEGSRAFIRLQEEIVKEYDDETVFAWKRGAPMAYAGLFAQSPADFADSGHIVPCQSTSLRTDPISVSSRGLRIVAPLQKLEDFEEPTFLLRLNCKHVHFGMRRRERVGIIVAKPFGIGHVYYRIRTNETPNYMPDFVQKELTTIFGLKESHIQDLKLTNNCGFWVRTPPVWPQGLEFEFLLAYPAENWDSRNGMFRRNWLSEDKRPFSLIFRSGGRTDDENYSYFVVSLGTMDLDKWWSRHQMWCGVKFYPAWGSTVEKLAEEAVHLTPKALVKGRDQEASDEGMGVTLMCYVQMEVVYGQHLFVADLHTKLVEHTGVVGIAECVKLPNLRSGESHNETDFYIWDVTESTVTLMAVCTLTLRVLLRKAGTPGIATY
ncbi:hypothetical protein OQA88_13506 [Cercophora sp. LCS_1]